MPHQDLRVPRPIKTHASTSSSPRSKHKSPQDLPNHRGCRIKTLLHCSGFQGPPRQEGFKTFSREPGVSRRVAAATRGRWPRFHLHHQGPIAPPRPPGSKAHQDARVNKFFPKKLTQASARPTNTSAPVRQGSDKLYSKPITEGAEALNIPRRTSP